MPNNCENLLKAFHSIAILFIVSIKLDKSLIFGRILHAFSIELGVLNQILNKHNIFNKKCIKKIKINGNVYERVEGSEKNMLINLKDNFKQVLIILVCMEKYIKFFSVDNNYSQLQI